MNEPVVSGGTGKFGFRFSSTHFPLTPLLMNPATLPSCFSMAVFMASFASASFLVTFSIFFSSCGVGSLSPILFLSLDSFSDKLFA